MLEGDKETFVKILLIMSECSAIFFCFRGSALSPLLVRSSRVHYLRIHDFNTTHSLKKG